MEINKLGSFFSLDDIEKIYQNLGVKKSWVDYTTTDGNWDENKYYEDFEKFWSSLDEKTKKENVPKYLENA